MLTIAVMLLINSGLLSQNIDDKIYQCVVSDFEQNELDVVDLMREIEFNLIASRVISAAAESRLEKLTLMAETGSIPGARTFNFPIHELRIDSILKHCTEVISYPIEDSKDYPLNQFFADLETLIDQHRQGISADPNKQKKLTAQLLVAYTNQFNPDSELWKMIQLKYLYIFTPPLGLTNLSEYFDHLDKNIDSSNAVRIFTDADNIITFDGEVVEMHQLCELLRPKILMEGKTILLQGYRATSYKVYSEIYDAINNCYLNMRNEKSLKVFKTPYAELSSGDRMKINRLIPKIINELPPR